MSKTQLDKIKAAEDAAQQLVELAAEIRAEAETVEDESTRKELLDGADGFEAEARRLQDALREWRDDIH